jgi:hypothetical protein
MKYYAFFAASGWDMKRFQNTNDWIADLSAPCLCIVIWKILVDWGKRHFAATRLWLNGVCARQQLETMLHPEMRGGIAGLSDLEANNERE